MVVVPYIAAVVPVHVPEAFEPPGLESSRNPEAAWKWKKPMLPSACGGNIAIGDAGCPVVRHPIVLRV